jgi:predicted dinucleotide-binding enzyme
MTHDATTRAEALASTVVVGVGAVGTHIATALLRAGHSVTFAARDPASDKVRAAVDVLGVDVVPLDGAGRGVDLVFLAVPFGAVADTVVALGDLAGAVLVDMTNTVGSHLPAGASTIVEVIAGANPNAPIVKAFNTIGAESYTAASIDGHRLFLPIAGDEPHADAVRALAVGLGFDALVIGDRSAVHLLEGFAALWIHMAFRCGHGRDFGFARLTRIDEHPTSI